MASKEELLQKKELLERRKELLVLKQSLLSNQKPDGNNQQTKSTNSIDKFLPGYKKTQEAMARRVDPVDRLKEEVMTPYDFLNHPIKSTLKPFVAGIKTLAIPADRAFSALGGLGVGLQRVEGADAFKRFKEGLTGEKQYRLFDPMRNIGAPEILTTPVEMFTEIAVPVAAMSRANKLFSGVTNATDAKLLQAGDDLIKGANEATNILGSKLDQAYSKINSVPVKAEGVLDDISKLPKDIIDHLEDEVGKLDEFLNNFNIEKARKLKQVLGELRPGSFGKAEKGAVEMIQDKKTEKAYSAIKKIMQKSLTDQGYTKEANKLLEADSAFTEAIRAAKFVKKTITDPTIMKPTKTSTMALKLAKEGDMTGRVALTTLKSAGLQANLKITKAIEALNKYNRKLLLTKSAGYMARGASYGAAAGLVGGKLAEKLAGE